jgi:hypothetical protein
MANYRAVVEWQNDSDTHWFTPGVIRLEIDPNTMAAIREVVPSPQGFPFPDLSAVAAAEADSAIRSTATSMSLEQVRSAQEAYESKHGSPSNDLRLVLRMMDEYTKRGAVARFMFWETIAS